MTPNQRKLFKAEVIVRYKAVYRPFYINWSKQTGIKTSVLRQYVLGVLTKHIIAKTCKAINEKTRTRSKRMASDPQSIEDFHLNAYEEASAEFGRQIESAENNV